jgi:hypothetical protein
MINLMLLSVVCCLLLVVLTINPTLFLVVVERCWLWCLFFVLGCIGDKSNVVGISMINTTLLLVVYCLCLVVLTINPTLLSVVVERYLL